VISLDSLTKNRCNLLEVIRRFVQNVLNQNITFKNIISGFANRILSWEGFMPLGRLSFLAYVVHYDFIKIYYINKAPLYFTKMDVMMNYFLVLMVSYMLSFILSICIEMPFINLDRYLMSSTQKQTQAKEHNYNLGIYIYAGLLII